MQIELDDCKETLLSEAEEFEALNACVLDRDALLVEKTAELLETNDTLSASQRECSRSNASVRRLTAKVETLTPETMDACLSARSFEENQLIQLRDEAISGKTKEVWLLTGENDRLRIQIDSIEEEMLRLQTDLVARDATIAKKERENAVVKKKVDELKLVGQQSKGRERAMEVAMTQNENLLKCLQAEEQEKSKLDEKCSTLGSELFLLKATHADHCQKAAVWEVEAQHKAKTAEIKTASLAHLEKKVFHERETLQKEMRDVRNACRVQLDAMQDELSARREKHYQMLSKVHEYENIIHHTRDSNETVHEELAACKERMVEMEKRMFEAKQWRIQMTTELQELSTLKSRNEAAYTQNIITATSEKVALQTQLTELQSAGQQAMRDQQLSDESLKSTRKIVSEKEASIEELKERVVRMVNEATKEGRARASSDLQFQAVTTQLEDVRSQMHKNIQVLRSTCADEKEKSSELSEMNENIHLQMALERKGKVRIVELYANVLMNNTRNLSGGGTLHLSDCVLHNDELSSILHVVFENVQVERIDLRGNRLSDASIPVFSKLFTRQPPIQLVDLRRNCFTLSGIRSMANEIGKANAWKTFHVFVQMDGKIQVLTKPSEDENEGSEPLLVVDVRNNSPDVHNVKTVFSKKRRVLKKQGTTTSSLLPELNNS